MISCKNDSKINSLELINRIPDKCYPNELIKQNCEGKTSCEIIPNCQEWDFGVYYKCGNDDTKNYQNYIKKNIEPDNIFNLIKIKNKLFSFVYNEWKIIIALLSLFTIFYYIGYYLKYKTFMMVK
jgi:hypothetical protein